MKKLELKHVSPYLPYDVKYCWENINKEIKYCGILSTSGSVHNVNNNVLQDFGLNGGYKLILRKLSDLTKEIEVNGEKFVPIKNLRLIDKYIDFDCEDRYCLEFNEFYQEMQKIFEWHFDVFGLIDKGLAIDINTI